MTHIELFKPGLRSRQMPCSVGAAAQAMLGARGHAPKVMRIFEHSHVPMVMADARRRYVEVNRPARLAFRLSLVEMRALAVDDLTPPELIGEMHQTWARLLDTGCVAGRYQVAGLDGSRLDIIYLALARVLPGLQLGAFAPAEWSDHELDPADVEARGELSSLTPREIEVLGRAAEGRTGPELARLLGLSHATIETHFKNIYEKLHVRTRAAAVAKAMRLGWID
jgi:DNA-binding CsgD family transcriptional regulator